MFILHRSYCGWRLKRKVGAVCQYVCRLLSQSHAKENSVGMRNVIISESECIHTNLALEDWLYENADLDGQSYLLLWRNGPAVVIGRHQNPWIECNVPEILRRGIPLVRRKSGGGTVYHDRGNLNCSVLTNRKAYNRKENLHLVVDAIQNRWRIPLAINSRDDIMLNGLYKISGTAAKLGGKRAYHHFTLLFSANLSEISCLLRSPMVGVETKATESVPAPVTNLDDTDTTLDFNSLTTAIAEDFLCEQSSHTSFVLPTETDFPGITEKIQEFRNPKWTFGKTPKFSVVRDFLFKDSVRLKISVIVDKGSITNIDIVASGINDLSVSNIVQNLKSIFSGKSLYQRDILSSMELNSSGLVIQECLSEVRQNIDSIPLSERLVADWIINCVKSVFSFC